MDSSEVGWTWVMTVLWLCRITQAWNTTCPTDCTCEYMPNGLLQIDAPSVDCHSSKLQRVPDELPSDTAVLLLQRNALVQLSDDTPLPEGILQLSLSHNLLHSLGPPPAWKNCTRLRSLDLSYNQLQNLSNGVFEELTKLQELNINHNQIGQIDHYVFDPVPNLHTLSLEGNRLTELNSSWFDSLLHLKTLSADSNEISTLYSDTFGHLKSLNSLSLRDNHIRTLEKAAFSGLDQLQSLYLDDNYLSSIPARIFSGFKGLKVLSLNKNPVVNLPLDSFSQIHVTEIHLSYMPFLQSVEAAAFHILPNLLRLEMHDNQELVYIDEDAFLNVQNLQLLRMHGNALQGLSSNIANALPNLEELTLYDNPILCDCNARWLQIYLPFNDTVDNSSTASYYQVLCSSPPELAGHLLQEIPELPLTCPPTVLAFFNDSDQVELGETVKYSCRALGQPKPHIHWILATGKIVNNTSNYSRVRLSSAGSLSLLQVKATDAGTYTCMATNSEGYDSRTTQLQIHSKNIHILHKGIATNFITVTWNGTDSTVLSSDYLILYRRAGSKKEYGRIHLRPYMRTYTITNLKPQTLYEFCIAYEHKQHVVKLHCLNIRTKHAMYAMQGIHSMGPMSVLISLVTTIIFIIFVCLSVFFLKRYLRRKSYQQPDGGSVPATEQKVQHMSQIPLDNLYNPPCTPLCTSRTSLISQSRAWRQKGRVSDVGPAIIDPSYVAHNSPGHAIPSTSSQPPGAMATGAQENVGYSEMEEVLIHSPFQHSSSHDDSERIWEPLKYFIFHMPTNVVWLFPGTWFVYPMKPWLFRVSFPSSHLNLTYMYMYKYPKFGDCYKNTCLMSQYISLWPFTR